jgi:hypothetical protein
VAAVVVSVLVVHLLTWMPPSATVRDILKPLERDIVAIAREHAGKDQELLQLYIARITALATVRIRQGANVPRDRRAWLRTLARLTEVDQT